MGVNLWLPQLQQTEFAKTHQINYFHESSVRSLKLLLHSKSGVPTLLPCYLIVVYFFPKSSTHHHFLLKYLILIWSISWNVRDSSADAQTRFELLSDLIILTLPLRPTNRFKLMMNESVLREYSTSMSMAILDRQVYIAPYHLTSFRPSFTRNEPNKSTPQYVNGGSSLILS